jgi:hypothetical protein
VGRGSSGIFVADCGIELGEYTGFVVVVAEDLVFGSVDKTDMVSGRC